MNAARYLYCVTQGKKKMTFGKIGIDEKEVFTIPYKDLCSVVQDCPAQPYKSENQEQVKSWIVIHEKVVEMVWKRRNTVLPFGFDTIVRSVQEKDAEDVLKEWMKDAYGILTQKLARLRERAEYGVQVLWDPKIIGRRLALGNEDLKKLSAESNSRSQGIAYLLQQKAENLMRKDLEREAEKFSREFFLKMNKYADEINVEKTKKSEEGRQMLINLSCLCVRDRVKDLGDELERLNAQDGFFVRFTGPWPPYSFV